MIRYLVRRHGGLKYERYDGPRPHAIPFPRWCISANLRSLVLSLSFLPSSSATFALPPPDRRRKRDSRSCLVLLLSPSSPSGPRDAVTRRNEGIPVRFEPTFGTPLSAPSNRHDPLFGGHIVRVLGPRGTGLGSRVLTLGISLAIVKSSGHEKDYRF